MSRSLLAAAVIVAAAAAALARPDTGNAWTGPCDVALPSCVGFIANHPALGGGGGRYYYM